MGGGGKDKSAQKAEKERQKRIALGMGKINDTFKGYNDEFYDRRAQDYASWAMPQVEEQYADAQKQLLFALARQYGSTNTSEAAARQADLAKKYGLAKTQQTEQSQAVANTARANVEDARTQLVAQLNATADPNATASAAIRQSELLNQTDPYTPLGELFANVTEGLAASQYPYGLVGAQPTAIGGASTGKKPKASSIVYS